MSMKRAHHLSVAQRVMTLSAQLVSLLSLLSLSACSLLLDPAVCERDSDCGGGVCQLGVCVGPREEPGGEEPMGAAQAGVSGGVAGEAGVSGAGAGAGSEPGGDEGATEAGVMIGGVMIGGAAGEPAGVEGGAPPLDTFECRFLLDQSVGERQAVYQGRLYSGTPTLRLVMEVFAPEPWLDQVSLLLGPNLQSLTRDEDGLYRADVTLEGEGEHRLRLLIGSESDVRCAEPLDVILDERPPALQVTNPATLEEWLQAQEGAPSAQVEMDIRDVSPVSVLQGGEVVVAELVGVRYTQTLSLTEGENRFTFVGRDLVGNESDPVEVVFHYDPVPPFVVISNPSEPSLTTSLSQLTIEGLVYSEEQSGEGVGVEPQARLELSQRYTTPEGEQLERTLSSADELGLFSLPVTLREGPNDLELCAYDLANNQRCASRAVSYIPELPCVVFTSPRYSPLRAYTLSAELCPSVSSVTLSAEGEEPIALPIEQGEGASTVSYSITLGEQGGSTSLSITASSEGGLSVTETLDVTLDETAPSVAFSTPEDQSCTSEQSVELCARVLDAESPIRAVLLNQVPITREEVESPVEDWWTQFCVSRALSSLDQAFSLSAENEAGSSATSTLTLSYDAEAPVVDFGAQEGGWYGANERGVTSISGSFERDGCGLAQQGGLRVYTLGLNAQGEEVRVGEPFTPSLSEDGERLSFVYLNTYSEGSHALEVELRDRAGNVSVSRHRFQVDLSPPELLLNLPLTEEVVGREESLSIELVAIDAGSGVSLSEARANGVPMAASAIEESSPPQWLVTSALVFPEGTHSILVQVEDEVGNVAELPLLYTRDLTPPLATLASPSSGEGVHDREVVLVSASDESTGVSSVTVNGASASYNGSYWVASSLVNPAEPSLRVSVSDRAGNVNELDPVSVTLPAYALRPGERSALPGVDAGLTGASRLWWGAWGEGYSLLILSELTERAQEGGEDAPLREQAGVSANGASRASPNDPPHPQAGRFVMRPQALLPPLSLLRGEQLDHMGGSGALTLFTLHEDGSGEPAPLLTAWQLGRYVSEELSPQERESLTATTLGLSPLRADVVKLIDLSADGRRDLIILHADEQPRFFTQTVEGALQFELNGLSARGLGELSAPERLVGSPALGQLWGVDVNRDDRVDLIQGATSTEGAKLWRAQPGSASYVRDVDFPSEQMSGYLLLDWDDQDELGSEANLELLAWSGAALKRYTLSGEDWSVQTLLSFPEQVWGAVAFDVDGDGHQELLTWGSAGLKAWSASGGSSPVHSELLPSLSPVEQALVTDLDQDGDEDLALRSEGALWLALANGASAHPDSYAGVRLEFRDGERPQSGANVRVLIDEDGDFTFERVTLARDLGDTVLPFGGEGQVNLQLIFPDRGELGGNQVALTGVIKGSLHTVADPQ